MLKDAADRVNAAGCQQKMPKTLTFTDRFGFELMMMMMWMMTTTPTVGPMTTQMMSPAARVMTFLATPQPQNHQSPAVPAVALLAPCLCSIACCSRTVTLSVHRCSRCSIVSTGLAQQKVIFGS